MAKEIVAAAVEQLAAFEIERLDRIRETILSGIASERIMLQGLAKDADDEVIEDLASDNHLLEQAEELIGKLLLVGLYRVIETLTKQTLRHRFPENKVQGCYQITKLKALFTDELGSNLEAIAGFPQIDEIRDLNNRVKHGGALPEPALKSYERLSGAVGSYLHDVAMAVIQDPAP